jgi:hypothetical protein
MNATFKQADQVYLRTLVHRTHSRALDEEV